MSTPQKFRTALNGFNREDVASYLEYLTGKYTAQINQLTSEADFLRSKLDSLQSADTSADNSAIAQECAQLRSELEDSRSQYADLQTAYDALKEQFDALQTQKATMAQELDDARKAPVLPAAPTVAPACSAAEELEIYRRAERTERMARERADLIYRQTNGILNEASVRVNEMADQVIPIADQILMQLSQLQATVGSTKQSLQDAVVIINTLRPDNN